MTQKRLLFAAIALAALIPAGLCASDIPELRYPVAISDYPAAAGRPLAEVLLERIKIAPFNLAATLVFFLSIIHTFSAGYFTRLSERYEKEHHERLKAAVARGVKFPRGERPVGFRATLFHYLGEVEVIFGIWLVPLFIIFALAYSGDDVFAYIDTLAFVEQKYTEPMFVVVVMCIAATKPVIFVAGNILNYAARLGKSTPAAWWVSILAIGPLLGSFITEPAAITICSMLLFREFYELKPSGRFKYATLGLLLTTVSAGGTLTHFAAPPVLMVAKVWGWDASFMFVNFGWKAVVGIFASVLAYYLFFRSEFAVLAQRAKEARPKGDYDEKIPLWIVCTHLCFLAFTVLTLHHPAMFIFAFLFFLGFTSATRQHQYGGNVRSPILVGFFLAGLVTHGSLQGWWIEPVLSSLGAAPLFIGAITLSSFNDNAAITYLASMVPDFSAQMKYLVVAGAVAGGGLTVIANAPNPAAVSILRRYYRGGISPLKLFLSALVPTAIISLAFFFL